MSNQSNDFLGGLQDAVRQNPVSATLIGMGILWMFTGGSKITTAAALLSPTARSVATGVGTGLQYSADAVGAATEGARSVGSRLVEGVSEALADSGKSAAEMASQTYETVKDTAVGSTARSSGQQQTEAANGLGTALQDNLKSTFERQPLLLGAIGLAIGAGMAAGLPRTQLETEVAGEAADRVKDVASEQVVRLAETTKQSLNAVKEEALPKG